MTARLRSDLLVSAILRSASAKAGFAAVRRRGHEEGGVVHVMVRTAMGTDHFVETQDAEGERAWRCQVVDADDGAIDEAIEKAARFDTDLWVVEVEGGVTIADLPNGGRIVS